MRHALSLAAGLLVGALLLWLAFRGVPAADIVASLKDFRFAWAPALLLLPALDLWLRAVRWRILLAPVALARVDKLFQLEAVGLAVNNVLVMRAGEAVRALLGGLELDARPVAVFSTILVERALDVAALGALAAAVLAWPPEGFPMPPGLRAAAAVSAAAGVVVLGAGLWVAAVWGDRFASSARRGFLARHPRLARFAEDAAVGARGLRLPGAWPKAAALSLALWLADAGVYWSAAQALDLEPALAWREAPALVALAAASVALPGAPGGFGNFEAAVKWGLMRRGTAPAEAVAYAAFTHLVMYAVVTTLGVLFLYRLGHSFESVKKAVKELKSKR